MKLKDIVLLLLCWVSLLLRTIYLFFPSLFFLVLATFVFWSLPQGHDIIRLCLSSGSIAGLVFTVAIVFWVFVTWYTARLLAYNHDDLYDAQFCCDSAKNPFKIGKGLLFHFPRLMAFSIFLIMILAILRFNYVGETKEWIWVAGIGLDFLVYVVFHWLTMKIQVFAAKKNRQQLLINLRMACWTLIICTSAVAVIVWSVPNKLFIIATLICCQLCFLFLIVTRKYVVTYQNKKAGKARRFFMQNYLDWVLDRQSGVRVTTMKSAADTEQFVFILFNIFSVVGGITYALCVLFLPVALAITPVPFLFLAFGVLLGMGNFVSLLSHRRKVNIHFLIVVVIVAVGFFTEAHWARTIKDDKVDYAQRMNLDNYVHAWLHSSNRAEKIRASKHYPVFIVLADGGASRSGYWTALVLSHLTSKTAAGSQPFLDHLICLSGASGGSVGHATFLAALSHQDLRTSKTRLLDSVTTNFLGHDFLSFTIARMLGPDLAASIIAPIIGDRAAALEKSIEFAAPENPLSYDMQHGFSRFVPSAKSNFLYPIVCFNTTRMQDGQPGVVCNINLDSTRFGSRLDVLDSLPAGEDLRLSTAMILSARFPYISPAGRIGNGYFVDGGYFDNSGAGVAHELLQGLQKMQELGGYFGDSLLLRKLQFYVIHVANSPYGTRTFSKVHPVENDLLAPLLTVAGSYSTQTTVNDTRLNRYLTELNGYPSTLAVNLYLKDSIESLPMNWVMSKMVRRKMDSRVNIIPGLDSLIARLNRGRTEALLQDVEPNSAPDPVLSKNLDLAQNISTNEVPIPQSAEEIAPESKQKKDTTRSRE